MSWYCLRTQPKREQVAARQIEARSLAEVYAPELLVVRKTKHGKKRFREALFPGYIFFRTSNYDALGCLEHQPGVSHIVRCGDTPACVDESLIEELQAVYSDKEVTMVSPPELLPGTPVDIVEGSFRGERAHVVGALPSGERVRVLLEFLGRGVEISIPTASAFIASN